MWDLFPSFLAVAVMNPSCVSSVCRWQNRGGRTPTSPPDCLASVVICMSEVSVKTIFQVCVSSAFSSGSERWLSSSAELFLHQQTESLVPDRSTAIVLFGPETFSCLIPNPNPDYVESPIKHFFGLILVKSASSASHPPHRPPTPVRVLLWQKVSAGWTGYHRTETP